MLTAWINFKIHTLVPQKGKLCNWSWKNQRGVKFCLFWSQWFYWSARWSTIHSFRWSIGCSQGRGGGYFLEIPIWQVCFRSSKVFGLSVLNMTGHLIILFVNFPYPGPQHFSNPYSSNSWVWEAHLQRKSFHEKYHWQCQWLEIRVGETIRETAKRRYGCGLTMASFSQREVR